MPSDVDGDGFITSMRVSDPRGEWKVSDADPRLMVQREPGEEGGNYYRLYPEGVIPDYDGAHVAIQKPWDGNLNRNFPANWTPEEYGAGESALSEPESRAVARFILDHPNIAGMNAYHTHGGLLLRPSMTRPDSAMAPATSPCTGPSAASGPSSRAIRPSPSTRSSRRTRPSRGTAG